MINTFEFELLAELQKYWKTTLDSIDTPNNIVGDVFTNLPDDGDYGANKKAIGALFQGMATGTTQNDLTFLMQFPTTKVHVPCITIEVGTEEEMEVIGAFVQEDYNESNGKWEIQRGGPFVKNFSVGVYSFSADATLYLYSWVKIWFTLIEELFAGYRFNNN
jgi:hypothetical protein